MYQKITFCEGNKIYNTVTLTFRERVRLLLKGTITTVIDQNVSGFAGEVRCYCQPKITKSKRNGG